MDSKTITISIDVEVYFKTVCAVERSDADGTRGYTIKERVVDYAEVLERVPNDIESWAKQRAIEIFEARY